MNGCDEWKIMNRRSFLSKAGIGVGALAIGDPFFHTVASAFAQSAGGTGNILVLCQLNGGMDVLSFLAPFKNAAYKNKRPQLALGEDDVFVLPDKPDYGISNLFPFFSELYGQNQLAVVQQVGYPDANGSHFESQDVFEYGMRNVKALVGGVAPWYERLRKTYFDEPFGVLNTRTIGDPQRYGYPDSSYRRAAQDAFGRLARLKKAGSDGSTKSIYEAYERIDRRGAQIRDRTEAFESSGDARGDFYRAAKLASAKLNTQIFKLSYGGFDTHASENDANPGLFGKLNDHFQQFVDDMKALELWERTCVCFYTEFGRRNEENGSPGTDHGQGSHMILAGPSVNGGLHGQPVSTADINEKSLPYYVDFRAVFGSCMQDWLGFDPKPVFEVEGETYDKSLGSSLFS